MLVQLEVPANALRRAGELARGTGGRVVLNAAPARELPLDLVPLVDVLVVNGIEARRVTRVTEGDEETLERALAGVGVPAVVYTRGAHGAVVLVEGRRHHVPAHAVKVVDTAGAGDAFIGALGARWASNGKRPGFDRLVEAVEFASAAGSLATTKRGTIPSIPTRAEIEARAAAARA